MSQRGEAPGEAHRRGLVRTPVDPSWPPPAFWQAPPRGTALHAAPPRRRGRRALWWTGGTVFVVLAVAAQFAHGNGGALAGGGWGQPIPSGTPVASSDSIESIDSPPDGVGETPRPTSIPESPEPDGTSPYWKYLVTQDDHRTPVTWSPCRPIHYVVRTKDAAPGALTEFQGAVAEVSRLTGLTFVYDGTTTENPSTDRKGYQPARYGSTWAPVLVAFVTSREDPDMVDDVVGDTMPYDVIADGGADVFVSGEVLFDRAFVASYLRRGEDAAVRSTMLHELGHLVGLDHVENAALLMNPYGSDGVVDFAPQEKDALRSLGAGACHADV
jgi:hypothetical protein